MRATNLATHLPVATHLSISAFTQVQGASIYTFSSMDKQSVSISTVSSADVKTLDVSLSTCQLCGREGVTPFPPTAVWTCRMYPSKLQQ
jgi:hypothetical protein